MAPVRRVSVHSEKQKKQRGVLQPSAHRKSRRGLRQAVKDSLANHQHIHRAQHQDKRQETRHGPSRRT